MNNSFEEVLLRLAKSDETSFSFIWRDYIEYNESASKFEETLKPFFLKENRVSSWPGTELDEVAATQRVYKLDNDIAQILLSFGSPFNFLK